MRKYIAFLLACLWSSLALAQVAWVSPSAGVKTTASSSITFTGYGTGATTNTFTECVVYTENAATSPNPALATVSSFADAGGTGSPHAWTNRQGISDNKVTTGSFQNLERWWMASAGAISTGINITATFSGAAEAAIMLCNEYTGVNLTNPYDPNVSLPRPANIVAAAGNPTIAGISTTEAATMVQIYTGAAEPSSACPTFSAVTIGGTGGTVGAQSNQNTAAVNFACAAFGLLAETTTKSSISASLTGSQADTITTADALCATSNATCAPVASGCKRSMAMTGFGCWFIWRRRMAVIR